MFRRKEEPSLRSDVTGWFIHEVRNALGPFLIDGVEMNWDNDDFERHRQILREFKKNALKGDAPTGGQISRAEMREFIDGALEERWDIETVYQIYQGFKNLSDRVND